ncbi:hypothetical protein H4R26_005006 [Coemansia thaxteri]|uniref:GH18 domain-containing protein n=1 Tax=Coemansia thaxteri TaxID=2663907 RepID=A0A9W8EG85_9FUNG|nr:hypothetical protein H4R26_005006 [Coemansia thaxteri]
MRLGFACVFGVALANAAFVAGGIIAGYAPAWKDVSRVDWSKYTHINLAYAEPQANGTFTFESSYNIDEVADRIHRAGARVLLSLGGYSGSAHISEILKAGDSRGRLTSNIVEFLKAHNLDGVDVDWIPSECNKVDVQNDASNLLVFVRELRQALDSAAMSSGAKRLIALGVGMSPFTGANGQPLGDVSEYANWVDYINILAYDINGQQSTTTGPNAPLNYELGRGVQQSLVTAVDNWIRAKFPASKITAGIAFYGRSATSTVDMSAQPWNVYQAQVAAVPRGDDDDGLWADRCTGKPPSYSGVWSYGNLRKQNVLQSKESAASPWQRNWDSVSLTPWLFNSNSKMFISYDDTVSLSAKISHVVGKGLHGVSVYDITMDYDNELINVIRDSVKPDSPASSSVPAQSTLKSQSASSTPLPPLPTTSESTSWQASSNLLPPPSPPAPSSSLPSHDGDSAAMPRAGSSCGWQALYKCVEVDGRSSQFMQCAAGIWVKQQCGAGTACVQNGEYVYCDYSR